MNEHIFKWVPNKNTMAGFYELKYIKDNFGEEYLPKKREFPLMNNKNKFPKFFQ